MGSLILGADDSMESDTRDALTGLVDAVQAKAERAAGAAAACKATADAAVGTPSADRAAATSATAALCGPRGGHGCG